MISILKSLFLVTFGVLCSGLTEDEGFQNFVTIALRSYPKWARFKGYDPAVNETRIDLTSYHSVFNMTGEIRNEMINGHSNMKRCEVSSSLLVQGGFTITCTSTDTRATGTYNLTGRAFSNLPIMGSGDFTIANGEIYSKIWFSSYQVTPDGYMDISATHPYLDAAYWANWDPFFDNFCASGYEKNVLDMLRQRYQDQRLTWVPMLFYLKEYLQEVFATKTLLGIFGTTLPPSTCPSS